ncbi:Uncharacterized protein BP5553_00520 [Venustampulla echinocandica]|uniref:Magnesium transport protein CorA, transmembrane region n=1 Tax=Venustampulla echinocandica TaxID=2656787 RepID=A0A370TYD9_9HELO|nr:Uncharacterized protein BP5553_00520 [Venustampulla echinocandica]RDL40541.1 Uncharacterized protein BP5553_00520 [Venustampulla echinocandica]
MDDYLFTANVDRCKNVQEATTYLEIFSYSDSQYNSVEEHPLTADEFDNYLHRRGAFAPPTLPQGVTQIAGLRLILQKNAKNPDTFAPHVISLKANEYKSMVEALDLPYRAIESTSAVGPFFWAAWDQDEQNPHLQIIFRKSDVRKKGLTRGWELLLSHDINNAITTGFCKGTASSDIVECIKHLKACGLQIGHPMLLPTIIFSHDVSFKTDIKQRDARDWLRRLEHAVSMRSEIEEKEGCRESRFSRVPFAGFMEEADSVPADPGGDRKSDGAVLGEATGGVKLQGLDSYAFTTLQRLDIQRSALYNIIAQKESKLNFKMAGEQRKLAHASKRDSAAMKTISLLGAIFLPGAYLASVFSMTFFNFQSDADPVLSGQFWIYWAFTIPITIMIVAGWFFWERRTELKYERQDRDLERGSEAMEKVIMAAMRRRTMSKASTWDTKKSE